MALSRSTNAVGFLSVNLGSNRFSLGSATLLTPEWVLTAAHVVTQNTPAPGSPAYATSQVTFGQGSQIPGTLTGSVGVSQIVVGTGWDYNLGAGTSHSCSRPRWAARRRSPATLSATARPAPA